MPPIAFRRRLARRSGERLVAFNHAADAIAGGPGSLRGAAWQIAAVGPATDGSVALACAADKVPGGGSRASWVCAPSGPRIARVNTARRRTPQGARGVRGAVFDQAETADAGLWRRSKLDRHSGPEQPRSPDLWREVSHGSRTHRRILTIVVTGFTQRQPRHGPMPRANRRGPASPEICDSHHAFCALEERREVDVYDRDSDR